MRDKPIAIAVPDAVRLRSLLATRTAALQDHDYLEELSAELERAHVLEKADMPLDVITMHSRALVRDLASGVHQEWTLVFPGESDVGAQRLSVLAPLGTALLGYREGDEVEWEMPGGLRRLRVERVHQPHLCGALEDRGPIAIAHG